MALYKASANWCTQFPIDCNAGSTDLGQMPIVGFDLQASKSAMVAVADACACSSNSSSCNAPTDSSGGCCGSGSPGLPSGGVGLWHLN